MPHGPGLLEFVVALAHPRYTPAEAVIRRLLPPAPAAGGERPRRPLEKGERMKTMQRTKRKKLRLGGLRIEGFETLPGRPGITRLDVTAVGECGDTADMWVCQSFEDCPPSHPFQKMCS